MIAEDLSRRPAGHLVVAFAEVKEVPVSLLDVEIAEIYWALQPGASSTAELVGQIFRVIAGDLISVRGAIDQEISDGCALVLLRWVALPGRALATHHLLTRLLPAHDDGGLRASRARLHILSGPRWLSYRNTISGTSCRRSRRGERSLGMLEWPLVGRHLVPWTALIVLGELVLIFLDVSLLHQC